MSHSVHVSSDDVRLPVARERLAALVRGVLRAEKVREAMISLAFVSDREMARLNRRHLGHAGATDVISFGFVPTGPNAPIVGDIYVCPAVARENARREGVGVREEIQRLVVHGTLHVLGHEHPDGGDRHGSPMWRRQEQLLRRLAAQPRRAT